MSIETRLEELENKIESLNGMGDFTAHFAAMDRRFDQLETRIDSLTVALSDRIGNLAKALDAKD